MLKEDRRWMSDRQRLNATFSLFIKRMEALVSFLYLKELFPCSLLESLTARC